MRRRSAAVGRDELRPEYDLSQLKGGVRGKYYRTSSRKLPEETPTPAGLQAIRRGRAAYERGDYVTLDELRREEAVARSPRRARTKVS
jgi:hypothetical protein